MKCECSLPWHPCKQGNSTGPQPSSSGCALPHQPFPLAHQLSSHPQNQRAPKKWKLTHRAITSWYQDLSHWQKKALTPIPAITFHQSPGIRSTKPGAGDTTFGTQAAVKHRKHLPNPSTLCWMAMQRVLQAQSNFLALTVELIFKKMAHITALGHSDHFLRSWNQSELLNSSSNPSQSRFSQFQF